jgi:alpha-galactosidase
VIHLCGASANVVVAESHGVPVLVHWGAPLGDVDLDAVCAATERPVAAGALDVVAPLSVVPEHAAGFPGRPGLAGHRRGGAMWAPRFEADHVEQLAGGGVVVHAVDRLAELSLATQLEIDDVLRVRCTLVNLASSTRYLLDGLAVSLPIPPQAQALLTFDGRWTREMHPVRSRWGVGAVVRENRAGRTSHEHPPVLFAGDDGFGEWHGCVWGAHLAWSGNSVVVAEHLPDGRRSFQLAELLHPGEIALAPGERYATPEVVGTFSPGGLTPASWGFHRSVRARAPRRSSPRPVLLNTWEAVYFDHDSEKLEALATRAAAIGVERFVLDDGWFGSRRDDRRGLGDWTVSADAHPQGLTPLIDHVRALGMEFGIWVEPEMVNPDSDVFREHPEWVLVTPGRAPVEGRAQLVLDLARAEAFDHVCARLDALLRDHRIAFVKWDMNRPHADSTGRDGAAGAHAQALAVERLIDELRARHPQVEFESCASGGGRIDHRVLTRVERVWASDCNDPLERQTIQRGASMLIPPEAMGAHIGPARAHTTGRTHSLPFRAATAMFGHLGLELDLTALGQTELDDLAAVIRIHRQLRDMLHGGDVVRFDPVCDAEGVVALAHGVYSPTRDLAIVSYAQMRTAASLVPPALRLPGLSPDAVYDVSPIHLPRPLRTMSRTQPRWLDHGIAVTGAQLAAHGLQLPVMNPETALVLRLVARVHAGPAA